MTDQDALSLEETLRIRLMLTACKFMLSESTAAEMIAGMGVKAAPVLIEWLEETQREIRENIVKREGGFALLPEGAILHETRDNIAIEALVKIGPPAIPAIMDAVRGGAASPGITEALTRMGSPAVPQLRDFLKDNNSNVQRLAAEVLGGIDDASAISALIETLKDEDPAMQFRAIKGLGEIAKKNREYDWLEAVPGLVNALKDKDLWNTAREALAAIGEPAVPALIDALNDSDRDVQSGAAEVLGEIGDVSSASALAGALKSENWFVAGKAAEALAKIARKHPEHDWKEAVSALIETLRQEDANARLCTANALGKIARITYIDLEAVKEALVGYVDSVKMKRGAAEINEAKRDAMRKYLIICEAVSKHVAAKHSLVGDGIILVGELPRTRRGRDGMYREVRRAFA